MPATIINEYGITFFPSEEAARKIADVNAAGDPDTEYKVMEAAFRPGRFTIAVIERETNEFVFYL